MIPYTVYKLNEERRGTEGEIPTSQVLLNCVITATQSLDIF